MSNIFDTSFALFYDEGVKDFLHLVMWRQMKWKIESRSTENKTVFHKGN